MTIHWERIALPERRGPFTKLAPSHFKVLVRRGQGATAHDIAREFKLSPRTVSAYLDRARRKTETDTVQELLAMFYREYAPNLWVEIPPPTIRDEIDPPPAPGDDTSSNDHWTE